MAMTVNAAMCLQKALRQRQGQLESMKNELTSKTRFLEDNREVVPTYDIKLVDQKIVKINNALLALDEKIKESNAKTEISLPDSVNRETLLSPIE